VSVQRPSSETRQAVCNGSSVGWKAVDGQRWPLQVDNWINYSSMTYILTVWPAYLLTAILTTAILIMLGSMMTSSIVRLPPRMRGGMLSVRCRLGVRLASPASTPLRSGLGQATDTCVPLSPSSLTWYHSKGGDALRLGRWP